MRGRIQYLSNADFGPINRLMSFSGNLTSEFLVEFHSLGDYNSFLN